MWAAEGEKEMGIRNPTIPRNRKNPRLSRRITKRRRWTIIRGNTTRKK